MDSSWLLQGQRYLCVEAAGDQDEELPEGHRGYLLLALR